MDARAALEWYSFAALKVMLRWRGHRGKDPRTKAECVAELRERLYDSDLIQRAIASCDDTTRDALALLRRKGGFMSAAAMRGQTAVWQPRLSGEEVQRVPSELVRRALAFWHVPTVRYAGISVHDVVRPAGDNPRSALVFSEPPILDHISVPPGLGQIPLVSVGDADPSESPAQSVRQILSFIRAVESRSPRVLRTGLIGARDRQALARIAGFEVADAGHHGAVSDLVTEHAMAPINFLHRALVRAGIVRANADGQLVTTEQATGFVGASPVKQAQLLLHAWLESGDNILLELNHIRCDRRAHAQTVLRTDVETRHSYQRLVDLLGRVARPSRLYSIADLSDVVRHDDVEFLVSWRDPSPYDWRPYDANRETYLPTSYIGISLEDSRGRPRSLTMGADWDLVEGAFIRAILRGPLTWLGLVRVSCIADGLEVFCLTRLGALVLGLDESNSSLDAAESTSTDVLVVQPNFDIVVYGPEDQPQLMFHIDRFAERVSVDRLAVYHLTRDSFCRALQLGVTLDDVIRLLEGAARTEIPQNVVFSLRDWARQFERIRVTRHGWLLEAPNSPTLDRWLGDSVLTEAIERRLAPTLALVRDTVALREYLLMQGLDVRAVDAESPIVGNGTVLDATHVRVAAIDANLYLGNALSAVGEVSTAPDGGLVIRLSEHSIRRAIQEGFTWDRIVDLLGQLIDGTIPAEMLTRVKGWSGAYPPIKVGAVAYVVAPDFDAFAEICEDSELAEGIIEIVSPVSAIVRLDRLDHFRSLLATRGIKTSDMTWNSPSPSNDRASETKIFRPDKPTR